jgi:DNA replication and repair protein RecF
VAVERLKIQQLRNLLAVDIRPSPEVNLFFGENGSGKTSILEALYILGLGRSFRSHKHKALINRDSTDYTVFSNLKVDQEILPLGLSRNLQGDLLLKANGENVSSIAELANFLPLQLINADTFLLLEGGPVERRQFLDWLVFHVEPRFYPLWKNQQTCLKHRNSLLRHDRMDAQQLSVWDNELIALTEQIDHYRADAFTQFAGLFRSLINEFIQLDGLTITYYSGWNKDKSYAEALGASRERDMLQGQTHVGSHRADLRIGLDGSLAADVLSRGQQKLLVCAMKVAQGLAFQALTGRKAIYLVDDLPAELDDRHREKLVLWLNRMETQVFVTGVKESDLRILWKNENKQVKVFHVEQGRVSEVLQDQAVPVK